MDGKSKSAAGRFPAQLKYLILALQQHTYNIRILVGFDHGSSLRAECAIHKFFHSTIPQPITAIPGSDAFLDRF